MAETRIDELRRRLERDPGSRLFAQLAEEHRKVGEHAEAIRVARAGLALHPAYPSARLTLGRALLDSGAAAAAVTELGEVLREAPDNILAGRFLGQALEMAGDVAAALKQYAATLKMAPGDRQLEAQIAALRLRAPGGGRMEPEVTAPMRPIAPPLPPGAGAAPRPPTAATASPAPPLSQPAPVTPVRPAVPAPPPTERMAERPRGSEVAPDWAAEGPSPTEATILIGRPAEPLTPPTPPPPPLPPLLQPPAAAPTPVPAPSPPAAAPALAALGGRLAEAPVSMSRPTGPALPEDEEEEAPTVPKAVVPDLPALASTLPPPERPGAPSPAVAPTPSPAPAAPPPEPAGERSFEETLEPEPADSAPPLVAPAAEAGGEAVSPAADAADTMDGGVLPILAAPSPLDHAADTLSPEDAAGAAPAVAGQAALSTSTLAELYLRQGLTERAREVYRQVLAEDPGNARARTGLRDLEAAIALGGPVAERAARRAALQRTIEALEAMLAAVRRD